MESVGNKKLSDEYVLAGWLVLVSNLFCFMNLDQSLRAIKLFSFKTTVKI